MAWGSVSVGVTVRVVVRVATDGGAEVVAAIAVSRRRFEVQRRTLGREYVCVCVCVCGVMVRI